MNIDKNLNMNQRYSVDGSDVAFFNGQVNDDGSYNTNRNVVNNEIYREHRDEVIEKFKAFEDEVYRIAQKVKVDGGLCK